MRNVRFLLLLFLVGAVGISCDDGTPSPTLPPPSAGGGFVLSTFADVDGIGPVAEGFVILNGTWQSDLTGAAGSASPFGVTTNELGLVSVDGTLMGQENATSENGTSIQISGFDISQLPPGTYAAFVSNAASGGGYTYLGNGVIQVANGGVDLAGVEQHTQVCLKPARSGCLEWGPTIYDSGTVSITVNGVESSVSYGENSTTWTIAVALANAINANSNINSLISSVPWVYAVLLDIQSGSGYSLSATATTNDPQDFPNGSFQTQPSGSTF